MRNLLLCCKSIDSTVSGDTRNFTEEDEEALARTVYHDARQSLTPSMLYRPAVASTRRASYSLDEAPKELLWNSQKHQSVSDTVVVRQMLEHEQPSAQQQPQKGYPGDLTQEELDACLDFRKQLKEKRKEEPSYYEMVYCYHGVEDEASALCRFMRARKFDVPDTFAMMQGNLETWNEGKAHGFYPDLEDSLGCPLSVLWTQFPYLYYGVAKNGAVVSYFQAGRIQIEAVECLTDIESIEAFIWNNCRFGFKDDIIEARKSAGPEIAVRCENVCVIDLAGLSRSLCNEKIIGVVKKCCRGLGCFPESLNKMVIVNAPRFFSVSWMVIKQFLGPRTVEKIEIYSNESTGDKHLLDGIDGQNLLSDYSGGGPSFDEVLDMQRKDEASRQIVERFFLAPHGAQEYQFSLVSSSEQANVTVYTRSATGATFTVSDTDVAGCEVKSENGQPCSNEIASQVKGPGRFTVAAKSASAAKECFLVVIRVYVNN